MFITKNKTINSPTGATVRPKIITRKVDQSIYTEGHYYDPISGKFLHKGIISIEYPDGTVETVNGKTQK